MATIGTRPSRVNPLLGNGRHRRKTVNVILDQEFMALPLTEICTGALSAVSLQRQSEFTGRLAVDQSLAYSGVRMLAALFRAFAVLSVPSMRRVVAMSLGLAIVTFAVLWLGLALVIGHHSWFGWRPLDWLADAFGVVAVAVLSWLLFPAVLTLMMGFFLERVAATVEALEYPGRGPARVQPIG